MTPYIDIVLTLVIIFTYKRRTHHVEDSHDEDEGGGGHGQGEPRPRLVRNDDRGSENPEP